MAVKYSLTYQWKNIFKFEKRMYCTYLLNVLYIFILLSRWAHISNPQSWEAVLGSIKPLSGPNEQHCTQRSDLHFSFHQAGAGFTAIFAEFHWYLLFPQTAAKCCTGKKYPVQFSVRTTSVPLQTSEFLVSLEICIQLPIWTSANSRIERFNHKFGFYSTRKWDFYLYSFLFQLSVILRLCSLLINTQHSEGYPQFKKLKPIVNTCWSLLSLKLPSFLVCARILSGSEACATRQAVTIYQIMDFQTSPSVSKGRQLLSTIRQLGA